MVKKITEEEGKIMAKKYQEFDNELTFVFDSRDDAANFKAWLCDGGGEQQFNFDDSVWYDFDWWNGAVIRVTKNPAESP